MARGERFSAASVPGLTRGDGAVRRGVVLVGAGGPVRELIALLREQEGYDCCGILDPDVSLKGEVIEGAVVLGWLGDIPRHASCALIGCPSKPRGFDRKSAYHILLRLGLSMPVFCSMKATVARGVHVPPGTVLLAGACVGEGATLGLNSLVGQDAVVARLASLPEHHVLKAGKHWRHTVEKTAEPAAGHDVRAVLATREEPLQRIVERINWANLEIILVVDARGRLIGTVTDGDIRRALLAGIDFEQPVAIVMNPRPASAHLGTPRAEMLSLMREKTIRHLPVVDDQGRPVVLERFEDLVDEAGRHDAVVMAGGLGSRLRPLTDTVPKPLLPIGNRPILDHILKGLKQAGIDDVVLSLNYRGDQIRRHVGRGDQHALQVNYITEKQRLGTAGALSLLDPRPLRPFLVLNGDLLTNLNFAKLLRFQREQGYALVMGVRKYKIQVPYGVVQIDGEGAVHGLAEKPTHEHFINAGIYVLEPACLDLIPPGTFFDMTDLIGRLLERGERVGAFPIVEYWRDIGRPEDLHAAAAYPPEGSRTGAQEHEDAPHDFIPTEALS